MKTSYSVSSENHPPETKPQPGALGKDRPTRILVVDDEPTIRLGVEYSLITEGYEVETASDGDEAIRRLVLCPEDELPDAVILDLRMPGSDGMAVMKRLSESGRVVPVTIASAYIDSPTAIDAVGYGVVDFLKKPITPDQVRGIVARMLSEEFRFGSLLDHGDLPLDEKTRDDQRCTLSTARCCLRRRVPTEAVTLLENADPEEGSDAALWLMISKQLSLSHEKNGASCERPSFSFYKAANLLDFLAYE